MTDPTYVRSEIDAKPEWELAFALSEIMNDNAPLGWGKYIYVAECLLNNYSIQRKPAREGEQRMPTPEALSLVHLIRHAVDMSDADCAEALDRFAAQRGAPATHEGHNEPCYYCGAPCNGLAGDPSQWPIPLCHADDPGRVKWHHEGCVQMRLIEGAPPQTDGGDAPHPVDGWTPEIMAEDARRFDEGLPAALDQFEKATGGDDAGERAKKIVCSHVKSR